MGCYDTIHATLANIMKTTFITLIFLLTIAIESFACQCPEYELNQLDKESYEWSDLVIIGKVVKTGTNYQIEVTEVLKGKTENNIINGTITTEDGAIDGCSFFPNNKGEYLFYLERTMKNGKPFYMYSQCLGTRPLSFDSYPISLSTEKNKSELIIETQKWIDELRKRKK